MAELLVELFSEEIPARMQARAADDLQRLACDGLKAAGLSWTSARAFATPRRLALVVEGLPLATPDRVEEVKGPRVGAPEQAVQGFLRKLGEGRTLDDCEKRADGKGESWVFVRRVAGTDAASAAAAAIRAAVAQFPWPKSMRWGANRATWVRPLHGVVALLDGRVLEGAIELGAGSIAFGDRTRGHRFLAPAAFAVAGFADYRDRLRQAFVILDPVERRAEVERQARAVAAAQGLVLKDDPGLLDEVAGLVEWPVAHAGTIDAEFMSLPPEVLATSMRAHQRYFTLVDASGATAPRFVVVANMATDASGAANIVAGNERVLRARLSDAKFFWDQDRRARLDTRVPALRERTFYARLGTLEDKVVRLQALAAGLAASVPGCAREQAQRAALLAKADLSTGMVGEFPELQGTMGGYYARNDGETEVVAQAIEDHYKPRFAGDALPRNQAGLVVALADKVETLVGLFGIGQVPTGDKDPFALRRHALGVIRMVTERSLPLALDALIGMAVPVFGTLIQDPRAALSDFVFDRLAFLAREQGFSAKEVDSVVSLRPQRLAEVPKRLEAVRAFSKLAEAAPLAEANKRIGNILRKSELGAGARTDTAMLREPQEQALHKALEGAVARAMPLFAKGDFQAGLVALAALKAPVDAFFDAVMVNVDDAALRTNRLALLQQLHALMNQVADLSRLAQ